MPEKRNKNPTSREIEKALEVMKSLGFLVTPPSSQVELEKQETSIEKLGFTEKRAKRKVKDPKVPQFLTCYLGATHYAGGQSYGPGEVKIPSSQEGLFRHLVYQDKIAKQAHYDTAQYNPHSHDFIISSNGNNGGFRKVEVSEHYFNSDSALNHVTITAGAIDIAGTPGNQFNE